MQEDNTGAPLYSELNLSGLPWNIPSDGSFFKHSQSIGQQNDSSWGGYEGGTPNAIKIGSMEWFPANSFPIVLDHFHNYDLTTVTHVDCFRNTYPIPYPNTGYEPPIMAFTAASGISRYGDMQADNYNSNSCSGYDYNARQKKPNSKNITSFIQTPSLFAKIYPNPNNGGFNLAYTFPSGSGELIITDISGREIYDQKIFGSKGVQFINDSYLPNGIYYWKIISGNEIPPNGKIIVLK